MFRFPLSKDTHFFLKDVALMVVFPNISKQIKIVNGVSHAFRGSEGYGKEKSFLGASHSDPLIFTTPDLLGW